MSNQLIEFAEVPVPAADQHKNTLQIFETSLIEFIARPGLQYRNAVVAVPERLKVFNNIGDVLALLDNAHAQQSIYVSKFIAAAASGLFDAALTYLWDETIFELRKRIVRYDLEYF